MSHASKNKPTHTLLERIDARARCYQSVRDFFRARNVREVETPLISPTTALDCHLHSLATILHNQDTYYLQTSPELAMKKLLAAGSGSIFQICKAFRNEEQGSQHHPEFVMLEWYRPGLSFDGLIRETIDLLRTLLPLTEIPIRSYRECFESAYAVNPHNASTEQLLALVKQHTTLHQPEHCTHADYLDALITLALDHYFQERPSLTPLIVFDYPVAQAAMSKVEEKEGDAVCKRFEVYVDGIELANGYDELIDPREQRRRFENDLRARARYGLALPPIDEALLKVMTEPGLPEMTGIAMGLDRVLMLALQCHHYDDLHIV